jgi:hypothetical protein
MVISQNGKSLANLRGSFLLRVGHSFFPRKEKAQMDYSQVDYHRAVSFAAEELLEPKRLYSAQEVFGRSSPVPQSAGIYAFYFDEVPLRVGPNEEPHVRHDSQLLYIGIAPQKPKKPSVGRTVKRLPSTLPDRFRTHFTGIAEFSTLRLSLGCVLGIELGYERGCLTFKDEQKLGAWMANHARMAWAAVDKPWLVEEKFLLSMVHPPLNIKGNNHPFRAELQRLRKAAKDAAMQAKTVADPALFWPSPALT